jgi:hypothetical protein
MGRIGHTRRSTAHERGLLDLGDPTHQLSALPIYIRAVGCVVFPTVNVAFCLKFSSFVTFRDYQRIETSKNFVP